MAMRQLLTDHARARKTAKRGGDRERVVLEDALEAQADESGLGNAVDLEILDAALTKLEELDERQSKIVRLRVFAGLSTEEVASMLDVSHRTVRRDYSDSGTPSWLRDVMPRRRAALTQSGGDPGPEDRP